MENGREIEVRKVAETSAGIKVRVCDEIINDICIEVEITDAMLSDERIDLTRAAYLQLFEQLGKNEVVVYENY